MNRLGCLLSETHAVWNSLLLNEMCNLDQIFVRAVWGKKHRSVGCTFWVALMNILFSVSWFICFNYKAQSSWNRPSMLRTLAFFLFIYFLSDQLFQRMKGFLVFSCWMFLFSFLFLDALPFLTSLFCQDPSLLFFLNFKAILGWFFFHVLTRWVIDLACNKWSQFCGYLDSVFCGYLSTSACFQGVAVEPGNSAQCSEKKGRKIKSVAW